MAHKLSHKLNITVVVGVCVCIFFAGQDAAGQGVGGFVGSSDPRDYQNNRRGQGNYGSSRQQDREQKAQQDIQDAKRALDETLVNFLQMVNEQSRPTPQQLEQSRAVVVKSKKHEKNLSDALKSELLILHTWNEYFSDNLQKAWTYSKTAYRSAPTNNDARATHVAMSLLVDKKPTVMAPPKPRSTRTNTRTGYDARSSRGRGRGRGQAPYNRSANSNYPNTGSSSADKASAGDILNLDIDAVDLDMIGRTVGPMRLACLNSTTLDYNPARSNLCLLFWQLASKNASGEPNNLSTRRSNARSTSPYGRSGRDAYGDSRRYDSSSYDRDDRGYDNRGYDQGRYRDDYDRSSYPQEGAYGYAAQPKNSDPFTSQIDAYGKIFGSQLINPQVRFVAINTDPASNMEAVVSKLLQAPMPWANVMAANPLSGAAQYADMNNKTPKLVVADRTGKIRYAGPAEGFLAPMLLNHIAGRSPQPGMTTPTPGGAMPSINPLKNLLFGRRNNTTTPFRTTTPPPNRDTNKGTPDEGELTPDSLQAQRLLEGAKFFVSAGRKPILTGKGGVELCRRIMREHPNTKQAQEARMLLRTVTERDKKKYGITDEELGY